MNKEEKYSFIIEFDEMTDKQINNLTDYFNNNKIKFHVLKSNYELKKQKEVIDKAIEFIKSSQCKYDGWEIANQLYENEIKQLLNILKEVSE